MIYNFYPEEEFYPVINFYDNGKLDIIGDSYMDDTYLFYYPLVKKINNFIKNPTNKNIEIDIKLLYYNSPSIKCIFQILQTLLKNKLNVNINWYYENYNEEIYNDIIDFEKLLDKKINKIEIDNKYDIKI